MSEAKKQPSTGSGPIDGYRDFLLTLQADHSAWQSDDCPRESREQSADAIAKAFPRMCDIVLAALEWRAAYDQRSITRMREANFSLRGAVDSAVDSATVAVPNKEITRAYEAPDDDKPLMPPWS